MHKDEQLPGKTVVIGGGNVAIDVARTAVRLGSQTTELYCLETPTEMPALAEEQHEAIAEGVAFNHSWAPKAILGENGKVTAVEFMRCTSVFDDQQRFNPQYDKTQTITVPCDNVLISVGQGIVWGDLLTGTKAEISARNTLIVDELTLQSADPDIFAGGDAITGPKYVIDAIAAGKSGATSMHRLLRGYGMKVRREREYHPLDKANLDLAGFDRQPRQRAADVDFSQSKTTFKDLRADLTDEQVMKEANRCLGCGVSIVDECQCIGCGVCVTKCEFDAVHLKRKYDVASAATTEQWGIDFMAYAEERAKRVAAKQPEISR